MGGVLVDFSCKLEIIFYIARMLERKSSQADQATSRGLSGGCDHRSAPMR